MPGSDDPGVLCREVMAPVIVLESEVQRERAPRSRSQCPGVPMELGPSEESRARDRRSVRRSVGARP